MATQIAMDHTGDTRHSFNPDDVQALAKAEKRCTSEGRKASMGFTAAVRTGSGEVSKIRSFDPSVDSLVSEGTFYLWSKWADSDPQRQWNALADRDVFVLPGSMMNAPDYFRISLTASDEMVERALPAFIDVA